MTNTHANHYTDDLARRIARGLDEEGLLPIYRLLVARYPEHLIKRAYHEALAIPPEKIRKTRGAVFNYLLKRYAQQEQDSRR